MCFPNPQVEQNGGEEEEEANYDPHPAEELLHKQSSELPEGVDPAHKEVGGHTDKHTHRHTDTHTSASVCVKHLDRLSCLLLYHIQSFKSYNIPE